MPIGVVFLLLSTVLGLVLFPKIKPSYIKLIVLLLLISSVNELLVLFILPKNYSLIFYNIYSLIEMSIWSTFITLTIKSRYKLLTLILSIILICTSVIEIIFIPGFHTISYRLYSVFIITHSFIYFYSLIQLKIKHYLINDGNFWFFLGLLIFHTVFVFYLTAIGLEDFQKASDVMQVFRYILDIINFLYYISISIGLLCYSLNHQ